MKKFLSLFICGLIGVSAFSSCNPFSGKEKDNENEEITGKESSSEKELTVEVTSTVTKMNIYVDASESMRPYFTDGHMTGIVKTLSNLYSENNSPIYFWDSNRAFKVAEAGDISKSLTDRRNYGKDSKHDVMIKKMVDLVQSDSLQIAALVTDGILGTNSIQTAKTPAIMMSALVEAENQIKNALKGQPNLGVSLYHLKGEFYTSATSKYYTYSNHVVQDLKISDRPYYVLLIGRPAQLRQIREQKILAGIVNELHLGLHDMACHQIVLSDGKHFSVGKDHKWKKQSGDECQIKGTLPSCLLGQEAFLKSQAVLTLNDKPIDEDCLSIQNGTILITYDIAHKATVSPTKPNTFILKISNALPDVWDNLSCEDDSKIKDEEWLQSKTFGLKYLVLGLYEGLAEDELLEAKYVFNK